MEIWKGTSFVAQRAKALAQCQEMSLGGTVIASRQLGQFLINFSPKYDWKIVPNYLCLWLRFEHRPHNQSSPYLNAFSKKSRYCYCIRVQSASCNMCIIHGLNKIVANAIMLIGINKRRQEYGSFTANSSTYPSARSWPGSREIRRWGDRVRCQDLMQVNTASISPLINDRSCCTSWGLLEDFSFSCVFCVSEWLV